MSRGEIVSIPQFLAGYERATGPGYGPNLILCKILEIRALNRVQDLKMYTPLYLCRISKGVPAEPIVYNFFSKRKCMNDAETIAKRRHRAW
jgi:hypothetical protein